jgi:GTP cyclohydrolase I
MGARVSRADLTKPGGTTRRASDRDRRPGATAPPETDPMDSFARARSENDSAESDSAAAPVRPSREQAMEAVRTLIAWTGDDPARAGLIDTPKRVVDAFQEWFQGYGADPRAELSRVFEEAQGYDDMVLLREIEVESHCEHHLAPFLGKAYVAYVPTGKVVGISKIARVVEIFSKRLQNQESLTIQIADALTESLDPQGVAVLIEAEHQCMTTRGVHHRHVSTLTSRFTGVFRTDEGLQQRFLRLARGG